MGLKAVGFD